MSDPEFQSDEHRTDIAVIGLACRFPGASTPAQFIKNLRDGVESVSFFSDEELRQKGVPEQVLRDPNFMRSGGVLEGAELFDALFFGYSPREAELMDPQHRVFLECAWAAMEDAGYRPEQRGQNVGVFAGSTINTYLLLNLVGNRTLLNVAGDQQVMLGNDKEYVATRASYKLNLTGPSYAVQTACSTSLVAVHVACQSLLTGECDMALAGGVSVRLPQGKGYMHYAGGTFSADGRCRAFDERSSGSVPGNGCGVVVLKRLTDAIRDRDHVYAVIKGSATNNDGAVKAGFTAPSVSGQARAVIDAVRVAGVDFESIQYVEAHGTGTALGDPIEIAALGKAFAKGTAKTGYCTVGSVKPNIGHLDAAAGIAGFIKTVLALHHRVIPPTLHFTRPNPKIDLTSTAFRVSNVQQPWEPNGKPRRAGVNSIGMGGTNAHVILEDAPAPIRSDSGWPIHVIVLSAKTPTALDAISDNLSAHLRQSPDLNLADVAYTTQVGRYAFHHRRVIVCSGIEDAIEAIQTRCQRRVRDAVTEHDDRPIALMFPGQGVKLVDAARDLYEGPTCFREHLDRCSDVLAPDLGTRISELLFPAEGSAAAATLSLQSTRYAQPTMFSWCYAMARQLEDWGVRPRKLIGHSLGEYVAACLAGVLRLEDALKLVAARGHLMEQMAPGRMLAVSMGEEELATLVGDDVCLASINSPKQCVLSGPSEAIARVERALCERGVLTRELQTSSGFHSRLTEPFLATFAEHVRAIRLSPPSIPLVSNVTGTWLTAAQAVDPEYWANHMRSTVRFSQGIRTLLEAGIDICLEVSPGRVLSSLVDQHVNGSRVPRAISVLPHEGAGQPPLAHTFEALAQLWLHGAAVDWRAVHRHHTRRRVPLPTYPFERRRYWVEPAAQQAQPTPSIVCDAEPASGRSRSAPPTPAEPDHEPQWWTRSWRPEPPPPPGARIGTVLLLMDDNEMAERLAVGWRSQGSQVVRVRRGWYFSNPSPNSYTVNPTDRRDFELLFVQLRGQSMDPDVVVHAWTLAPGGRDALTIESFERAQEQGFYSLLALGRCAGSRRATPVRDGGRSLSIVVLTTGVHEVSGEEALHPENATVIAACRVFALEYPELHVRVVDVVLGEGENSRAALARQVLDEIASDDQAPVIALRGRRRWSETVETLQIPRAPSDQLKEGGVYLIAGGLGSAGLACAEFLARSARVSLALIDRVALQNSAGPVRQVEVSAKNLTVGASGKQPGTDAAVDSIGRSIRAIDSIRRTGANLVVVQADVGDLEQTLAAVQQVRERFGRINGIIHAAGISQQEGVLGIHETEPSDCRKHFRAKVYGLLNLRNALREEPPEFYLLASSLSSFLGGIGIAAYTAANAFMDAMAHMESRCPGSDWISVNWERWSLDGESRPQFVATRGERVLDREQWLNSLAQILAFRHVPQVALSLGSLAHRLDQRRQLGSRLTSPVRPKPPARADPSLASPPEKLDASPPRTVADDHPAASVPHACHARPALAQPYVAPRNQAEARMTRVWEAQLGVHPIGIHDNFFELGGHSFMAAQIAVGIQRECGIRVTEMDMFKAPTVALLSASLASNQPAAVSNALEQMVSEIESLSREEVNTRLGEAEPQRISQSEAGPREATHSLESGSGHPRPDLPNPYVGPRDEFEHELVRLWEGVLGIRGIGIHDNFFELGGHSLMATQMIARLRDSLHREISLASLLERPTIAGLNEAVRKPVASRQTSLVSPSA